MPDFISTNVSKQNTLLALNSKIVKLILFHNNIETFDIYLIYENFSTFHVGIYILQKSHANYDSIFNSLYKTNTIIELDYS